ALLTLAEVTKILEWDWTAAEQSYRTAVAFNPSNEAVHRHYGLFLAARRRSAEAAAEADRACDLDPLCLVVNTAAGWVRFVAHEYDRAIAPCRHTLDMDAASIPARRLLTTALALAGRLEDARHEIDRLTARELDPVTLAWVAHALVLCGERDRAGGL